MCCFKLQTFLVSMLSILIIRSLVTFSFRCYSTKRHAIKIDHVQAQAQEEIRKLWE